jgi:hypothetical protein
MGNQWGDEIVEERSWRSGVEVISRVNWSHIARVRRALGIIGVRFAQPEPPIARAA